MVDDLIVDPKKLRAWRKSLKLSQQQVGIRARIVQPVISSLEKRLAGEVGTYLRINQALRAFEREQQSA